MDLQSPRHPDCAQQVTEAELASGTGARRAMSAIRPASWYPDRLQWVDCAHWRSAASGKRSFKGCFSAMNLGRRPACPDPNPAFK